MWFWVVWASQGLTFVFHYFIRNGNFRWSGFLFPITFNLWTYLEGISFLIDLLLFDINLQIFLLTIEDNFIVNFSWLFLLILLYWLRRLLSSFVGDLIMLILRRLWWLLYHFRSVGYLIWVFCSTRLIFLERQWWWLLLHLRIWALSASLFCDILFLWK